MLQGEDAKKSRALNSLNVPAYLLSKRKDRQHLRSRLLMIQNLDFWIYFLCLFPCFASWGWLVRSFRLPILNSYFLSSLLSIIPKILSREAFSCPQSSHFLSSPFSAIETSPVSSETTMQALDETSVTPIAALWRVPCLQLSFGFSVSGNKTPADKILLL